MALEKVAEQVAAAGRAEARKIAQEAKAQAESILAEARVKAKEVSDQELARARQQGARLRQRDLSAANLESKKAKLNAEKEVLARVKANFLAALGEMPPAKREKALAKLASKEGFVEGRVYANVRDADAVRKLSNLQYGGDIDCLGGMVMENQDGSVSLVYTFDTIAEEVWVQDSKHVYDVLFG